MQGREWMVDIPRSFVLVQSVAVPACELARCKPRDTRLLLVQWWLRALLAVINYNFIIQKHGEGGSCFFKKGLFWCKRFFRWIYTYIANYSIPKPRSILCVFFLLWWIFLGCNVCFAVLNDVCLHLQRLFWWLCYEFICCKQWFGLVLQRRISEYEMDWV